MYRVHIYQMPVGRLIITRHRHYGFSTVIPREALHDMFKYECTIEKEFSRESQE